MLEHPRKNVALGNAESTPPGNSHQVLEGDNAVVCCTTLGGKLTARHYIDDSKQIKDVGMAFAPLRGACAANVQ